MLLGNMLEYIRGLEIDQGPDYIRLDQTIGTVIHEIRNEEGIL